MFTIDNHPLLPLYVDYANEAEWTLIGNFNCCDLDAHSFKNEQFLGINVCPHCGQIDAVFELFASKREDGAGAIYTMISIENVREFAGCKTAEECERVADLMVSGIALAA